MPTQRRRANVALTEEQAEVLYPLAEASGLTVSELVRRALDAALPIYADMLPHEMRVAGARVTLSFRLLDTVRRHLRPQFEGDQEIVAAVEELGGRLDAAECDGSDAQAAERSQSSPPILTGGSGRPKSLKSNVVPLRQGGR